MNYKFRPTYRQKKDNKINDIFENYKITDRIECKNGLRFHVEAPRALYVLHQTKLDPDLYFVVGQSLNKCSKILGARFFKLCNDLFIPYVGLPGGYISEMNNGEYLFFEREKIRA